MTETLINGRWTLDLPPARAARPEWPWWEAARLSAEHAVITGQRNPVVWCVGAEAGDFPALYASWGADVLLIEPNAAAWPSIRLVFEANKLCPWLAGLFVGFAAATSSADPIVSIGWPAETDLPYTSAHGWSHINDHPDVQRVALDDLVDAADPPTVITIDVEGAEDEVLAGAEAVLAEHRPVVFISVHDQMMGEEFGYDPTRLYARLASVDYRLTHLATDHEEHVMAWPAEACPFPGLDPDSRYAA